MPRKRHSQKRSSRSCGKRYADRTGQAGTEAGMSTPEGKCGGWPEQKCSSGAIKKAPDIGGLLAFWRPIPEERKVAEPWGGVIGAWSGRA